MADVWFFDVFPCRPRPYFDESLSSYLLRLAEANGFATFWHLVQDLFPTWPQTSQLPRLRWEYPVDEWGAIPLRTQLSLNELTSLTVAPLVEKFRPLPVLSRLVNRNTGHFLKTIVNTTLQVCPLCLKAQSYWRLAWRLTATRICLHHHCFLQTHCHHCCQPLTVVTSRQRLLYCTACGADLRDLPVVTAPTEVIPAQRRQQENIQFLLNPTVSLVPIVGHNEASGDATLQQAIGLKFRYLRFQAGMSVAMAAQMMETTAGSLKYLERGQLVPLHFYLRYLEIFSLSWFEFAMLAVPSEFIKSQQQPAHWHLRICPEPLCPNHSAPPSIRVRLTRDIPERRIARFRCTTCGRRFTYNYDGILATKQRRPPVTLDAIPAKPETEVDKLMEWGLQGVTNREIACRLGWGEKTVRLYWEALGVEEQVHQAQATHRTQGQRERIANLSDRMAAILLPLLDQDKEITIRQLGCALGYHPDYLQCCPDMIEDVRKIIRDHNIRVKQQRHNMIWACITQALEALPNCSESVSLDSLAQQAGISAGQLRKRYPDLNIIAKQAIERHRLQLKEAKIQTQCAQINDAASRLVSQGIRLTNKAILREAGLHDRAISFDMVVQDLLRKWVGNFAPRD